MSPSKRWRRVSGRPLAPMAGGGRGLTFDIRSGGDQKGERAQGCVSVGAAAMPPDNDLQAPHIQAAPLTPSFKNLFAGLRLTPHLSFLRHDSPLLLTPQRYHSSVDPPPPLGRPQPPLGRVINKAAAPSISVIQIPRVDPAPSLPPFPTLSQFPPSISAPGPAVFPLGRAAVLPTACLPSHPLPASRFSTRSSSVYSSRRHPQDD